MNAKATIHKTASGRAGDTRGAAAINKQLAGWVRPLETMIHEGRSGAGLLEAANTLAAHLRKHRKARGLDARLILLAHALLSEAYDTMGRFLEAKTAVADGSVEVARLPGDAEAQLLDPPARRMARDRVRYCLAYALSQYRQHHYADARPIVEQCLSLASGGLVRDDTPNFGLRGGCAYLLGRILRQQGDYDEATRCFEAAIRWYYERANSVRVRMAKSTAKASRRPASDAVFSVHRSALCSAFGLGWVHLARGNLTQAWRDSLAASAPLLQAGDQVNARYVETLLGSILRQKAGTDEKQLREAEVLLNRACVGFEALEHDLYRARAACEIATTYLYLGDLPRAAARIDKAEQLAKELDDISLQVQAATVKSRIVRSGEASDEARQSAVAIATTAIELVARSSPKSAIPPALEIAALIARGVARFYLNDYAGAEADLRDALALNRVRDPGADNAENNSPMLDGTCHIFLAWTLARAGAADAAMEHLHAWQHVEPWIEQRALRQRAAAVGREIDILYNRDFVVLTGAPSLKFDEHEKALKKFLLHQADLRAHGNKVNMGALLGVTRQTVHAWERGEFGRRKTRRRRRRST